MSSPAESTPDSSPKISEIFLTIRHLPFISSELLTWGSGNLSAFWAFARGCDRVMHLQFRAGELGVSLVQVRAKRFEDSRSMRRTEWGQGDTKLLFRGFEISGIL